MKTRLFSLILLVFLMVALGGCTTDEPKYQENGGEDSDIRQEEDTSQGENQSESDVKDGEGDGSESDTDASPGTNDGSGGDTSGGDTSDGDTSGGDTSDGDTSDGDTSDGDDDPDVDPYPGRPAGQCSPLKGCPGSAMCNHAFPGGKCNGCGSDAECPEDFECGSGDSHGACLDGCENDDECAPGARCITRTGICTAIDCVDGECPVPYLGCNSSDRCARISCKDDPSICPAGTTCMSNYCIENRAL